MHLSRINIESFFRRRISVQFSLFLLDLRRIRRDGLSRQNIREYTFDASVTRHGIYTVCVESAPRRARVLPRAKTKASSGASKRCGSTVTRSLRSLWLVLLAPMIYRTVVLTYKTVIIFYHPAGSTETSAMHDRRPYLA